VVSVAQHFAKQAREFANDIIIPAMKLWPDMERSGRMADGPVPLALFHQRRIHDDDG
jgi:hypothetical protein